MARKALWESEHPPSEPRDCVTGSSTTFARMEEHVGYCEMSALIEESIDMEERRT
jgi:hypothetical protein